METDQGDVPTSQGMPKITSKAPETSREQNVPLSSPKGPTLSAPRSHTSSFQKCETINSCCWNHTVCVTLLQQPGEMNILPFSKIINRFYSASWFPEPKPQRRWRWRECFKQNGSRRVCKACRAHRKAAGRMAWSPPALPCTSETLYLMDTVAWERASPVKSWVLTL